MASAPKRIRVDTCGKCGGEIKNGHLGRHLKTCIPRTDCCYDCPFCLFMGCRDLAYMITHCKKQHEAEHKKDDIWKCKRCGWGLTDNGFFEDEAHVAACLRVTKGQVEDAPLLEEMEGAIYRDFPEDPLEPDEANPSFWESFQEEAHESIRERWSAIRQHVDKKHGVHKYVFRAIGSDVHFNFEDALLFIYAKEDRAFCFNVAEDYLLNKSTDSQEEDEYRAWIAQNGQNTLFEQNVLVHDLATLKIALEKVQDAELDLMEGAERPGSAWVYVCALSYTFFIYPRPQFVLGKVNEQKYPKDLARNKAVDPMLKDKNGHYYDDNLCFFRCLTKFLGRDHENKEEVWTTYEKYRRQFGGPWWWDFQGLRMEEIPRVEKLFKINVKVGEYQADGNHKILRKPLNMKVPTMSIMYNKW